MSIEQFLKVIKENLARKINSLLFVHIATFISWTFGLTILLLSVYFKCHKQYLVYVYRYHIYCGEVNGIVALASIAGFCTGSLAILYTAILVYMKCKAVEVCTVHSNIRIFINLQIDKIFSI